MDEPAASCTHTSWDRRMTDTRNRNRNRAAERHETATHESFADTTDDSMPASPTIIQHTVAPTVETRSWADDTAPVTKPTAAPAADDVPQPSFYSLLTANFSPEHVTHFHIFCTFCYTHCLALTTILQLTMLLLFVTLNADALKASSSTGLLPSMQFFLIFFELLQLVAIICSSIGMMAELSELQVRPKVVCYMYLSTALTYTSLYFTMFCFNIHCINLDGYSPAMTDSIDPNSGVSDLVSVNDLPSVYCYFIYFSGAVMSSTGFGDITPTMWYTQLLVNSQQLVGTAYHSGIFGITLQHFRTYQKYELKQLQMLSVVQRYAERDEGCVSVLVRRIPALQRYESLLLRIQTLCIQHVLLVSLVLQSITLTMLFTLDEPFHHLEPGEDGYTHRVAILSVVALLLMGQFLYLVYMSLKLVRDVTSNQVTASFLLQSFLSCALLYAALYLVLYTSTPTHQFYKADDFGLTLVDATFVFIHFSFTVLTSTGFGDVYARGVLARMLVLSEMWVCILYICIIIGLGSATIIEYQSTTASSEFDHTVEEITHHQHKQTGDEHVEPGVAATIAEQHQYYSEGIDLQAFLLEAEQHTQQVDRTKATQIAAATDDVDAGATFSLSDFVGADERSYADAFDEEDESDAGEAESGVHIHQAEPPAHSLTTCELLDDLI